MAGTLAFLLLPTTGTAKVFQGNVCAVGGGFGALQPTLCSMNQGAKGRGQRVDIQLRPGGWGELTSWAVFHENGGSAAPKLPLAGCGAEQIQLHIGAHGDVGAD